MVIPYRPQDKESCVVSGCIFVVQHQIIEFLLSSQSFFDGWDCTKKKDKTKGRQDTFTGCELKRFICMQNQLLFSSKSQHNSTALAALCIYTYIGIHVQVFISMYIYTYTCVYIYIYTYIGIYICIYILVPVYIYIYIVKQRNAKKYQHFQATAYVSKCKCESICTYK